MRQPAKVANYLHKLINCRCNKTKRRILKTCPAYIINAIAEIITNLFAGNFPLTGSQLKLLKAHRSILYKLKSRRVSLKSKRKLLQQQQKGSGVVTALVLGLPIVIDLIRNLAKKS